MGKLLWKIKNELDLLLSSMFLILAVMAQFCDSLSSVLEVKSNHIKDPPRAVSRGDGRSYNSNDC